MKGRLANLPLTVYNLQLTFSVAVKYRRVHFKEARTAKDGAALRWVKRHRRCLTAFRTVDRDFDSLPHARSLSSSYSRQPFVLRLLTFLATLGWILKFLIAEKGLFSDSPNEIDTAVDAEDRLIVKF